MVRFNREARQRIRRSVKYTEKQRRNDPPKRGRWQGKKQAILECTLDDDVSAVGDCSITVTGTTRSFTAYMPASPGTGMVWAGGATVFVAFVNGKWQIVSITVCPTDA